MYYRYFTCGSMSEKEGLTTAKFAYYDDGSIAVAPPNPKKCLYKAKEITKEEYEELERKMKSNSIPKGFAGGIINEEGLSKCLAWIEEVNNQKRLENEPKIALSVKKIKKLLQLEIIEQSDVDTEIEQQAMTEFKDEIKKRLEQN